MAEDQVIVRDNDPRCAQLEVDGYRIVGESWGARLRLSEGADWSRLVRAVARSEATGLIVRELGSEFAQALFELEAETNADYPYTPATFQTPQQFPAIEALWSDGKRVFGALHGDRLVGAVVGAVVGAINDGVGDNDFASVLIQYRGTGVGAAVSALSILTFAEEGVRLFTAGGAALNDASLGLVRCLGFIVDEQ